jgi:hypothetical protein
MFQCERCGSRYSAMRAATIENCPRCLARDKTASPLTFKAFRLPNPLGGEKPNATPGPAEPRQAQDRTVSF